MSRVLMSLVFRRGWRATFFELDRHRSALPRTAFFNADETLIEFIRHAGGCKTLEDRNILVMQLRRNFFDAPSISRRSSTRS